MVSAGFISDTGKVTSVYEHSIASGGKAGLTKRLKTEIRFRIYQNQVVFETLRKTISKQQHKVVLRYSKSFEIYNQIISINKDYQQANGFISKSELNLLRLWLSNKVEN